jgi:hypothetical protein
MLTRFPDVEERQVHKQPSHFEELAGRQVHKQPGLLNHVGDEVVVGEGIESSKSNPQNIADLTQQTTSKLARSTSAQVFSTTSVRRLTRTRSSLLHPTTIRKAIERLWLMGVGAKHICWFARKNDTLTR